MSRPSSARPVPARRTSSDPRKRDEDEIYEWKAAFLVVAKSVSDELTTGKQLYQALQQAGRNPPRRVMEKYWTEDTEGINFEEFCDICRKVPVTTEDQLIKAFRKIDINGDGYISNSELQRVLTTRGEKMSKEEVQEIIDEVDENKDGKLDYQEFCKMLLSTQEECKKLALKNMEKQLKKSRSEASPKPDSKRTSGSKYYSAEGSASKYHSAREGGSTSKYYSAKGGGGDSDDDSDDDIVISSSASLRKDPHSSSKKDVPPSPKPRKKSKTDQRDSGSKESRDTASHHRQDPDAMRETSGYKEWSRPALASHDLKLNRPKKLKDWGMKFSNGCFYFDEDGHIISHQYQMTLTRDTSVWITIEPFSIRPGEDLTSAREVKSAPIDTMVYILRSDGSLVNFTEQRDGKGTYAVRCDMVKGKYTLVPFTTGCRFKRRSGQPAGKPQELVKQKGDSYVLTKQFKEALGDILTMCDLDGNGCLSRDEFNWFNLRTSGEEVQDEEWDVVEENVELKNGELTRNGFVQLNQMEAEDNNGDTGDLWVTLDSMGFNKQLKLDEAVTYVMEVFTEHGEPGLSVTGMDRMREQVNSAIIDATIGKGEVSRIKQMKDLCLHNYMTDFRSCLVLQNKSHSKVRVEVDCSSSKNTTSHRSSLKHTVTVPAKTSVIAHHLLPAKENHDWILRCQENVIK